MPAIFGNALVIAALLAAVALAVRSLYKAHRSGKGCSGNCANCRGCH